MTKLNLTTYPEDGRLSLDMPRMTRDEATEHCAHFLQLAGYYFELTPHESGARELLEECERLMARDGVREEFSLKAARLWVRSIDADHTALKKKHDDQDLLDGIEDGLRTLPVSVRDGIRRYVTKGIQPGGFLTAVLTGDRDLAAQLADNYNGRSLIRGHWDAFLPLLPPDCWGSPEKVAAWRARWKQGEGSEAATAPANPAETAFNEGPRPGEPSYNDLARALKSLVELHAGELQAVQVVQARSLATRLRFEG